ncbi:uncharacterized protein LOC141664735 [Apium graveolens]|uniref:uncharacterized protein LOC141664735 n=1 Tax=Apium graveolens TaxID=4045 RepID=UPI003D7AC709
MAIKGQALADFILEFDAEVDDKAIVLAEPSSQGNSHYGKREELPHPWGILHVDGAVNNNGSGARIVLVTLEGHRLMSAIHFKFYVTNNDAEYEALINGLKLAQEVGAVNLIVRSDSELVVNQANGGFQARGPRMELYMRCAQRLLKKFESARLESVPREENSNADALVKMGSRMDSVQLGQIPLGIQEIPSIPEAAKYVEYDGMLYKRGFNQPLLRCVDMEEGNYILREVHEGICGNHLGGGSLALKVLKQGYYWPTMREDAFNFVRACDRCQRFTNYSNATASTITSLASPWPFSMWGIDLIGELPKAKGGVKYAVVAVDYFTKWAEAMPLATIMAKKIRDFVFNSIVCRFGIPYKLISDNGKQFDSKELRKLCEDLKIKKDFAAVYHPQSNGQMEAINKIIKHTLKEKLEEKKEIGQRRCP